MTKTRIDANLYPILFYVGMVSVYFMQQLWLFWTMFVSLTLWKLYFPFHFRGFIETGKMKAVYYFVVLIGYIFPLVPALAPVISFVVDIQVPYYSARNATFLSAGMGYQTVHFPPILCAPLHYIVMYYTFVMPIKICFLVGGTLLVFILRHVWKVCAYIIVHDLVPSYSFLLILQMRFQIKTSEKYLLLFFCYFMFAAILNQYYYSILLTNFAKLIPDIFNYFGCEENGHDPKNPCDRSKFEFQFVYVLTIFAHITISLLSVILLLFVLNIHASLHEEKKKCRVNSHLSIVSNIKQCLFLYGRYR